MRTLYVTDLDGTLFNSQAQISEYSLKTINKLIEEGMLFTYATARSLSSAKKLTKDLKINCPVVLYNGAFIMDFANEEILEAKYFKEEDKEFLLSMIAKNKLDPLVYGSINGEEKVSWLLGKKNKGMENYLTSRKGDKRLNPLSDFRDLEKGDVFYFTLIDEKENLVPLYKSIKDNPAYFCLLHQDIYLGDYWCEIMPRDSTKANAVLKLKEILQCEKIVFFGDAANDLPLFKVADEAYAVENALDELKSLAKGIIPSNDEDGVAKFLKANWK